MVFFSPRRQSIAWISLWGMSFSLAMISAKAVPASIPSIVVVWMRCLCGFIFLLPFVVKNIQSILNSPYKSRQIIRGFSTSAAMLCSFVGYRFLPGETVAFLGASGPFFVITLAHFFLGEKLTVMNGVTLVLAYVGILCILQPVHLFYGAFNVYMLLPIVGNIFAACSITLARSLAVRQEATVTTLFYNTLVPFMVSSVGSFGAWKASYFNEWLLFIGIGSLGALSQLFYFKALRLSPASFVAPLESIRLCFFISLNWFIFGEPIVPRVWLGGGLIMVAIAVSAYYASEKKGNR